MQDWLGPLASGVFGGIVVWFWLARQQRRPATVLVKSGDRRIAPSRPMVITALLACPFLIFVGYMAAQEGSALLGWSLAGLAVVAGVLTLPALGSSYDVIWNDQGIAGPTRTMGPILSTARDHAAWDELVGGGVTLTGYFFVETLDGRRVYWSTVHAGYGAVIEAIKEQRPDLFDQDAD